MLNIFKKIKLSHWKRTLQAGIVLSLVLIFVLAPISNAHAQVWDLALCLAGGDGAIACAFNSALAALAEVVLLVSSWLLFAGGLVLNAAIQLSVTNFQQYANSEGVNTAWSTFRDMANMAFIFILLYIAIGTILGLSNINMKKMLTRIIIVALLLNFSLFFTKIAIDVSNILAVGFYNSIVSTTCGGDPATGITNAIMCKMGLTDLYSVKTFAQIRDKGTVGIIGFAITGSTFMVIAAFVFLAGAIMFIARTIVLVFLLVLSPLAFIAMALPNDKYSDKWWKKLIDECIFAPAFLALLWVTIQVLEVISKPTNISSALNFDAGQVGVEAALKEAGDSLMNFGIIVGLIIASLIIAKQFGSYGAKGALGALDKGKNWAQGKIGRGTVRALPITGLDKRLSESRFGQTAVGRTLRDATTGALVGAKFGSGKSVADVNKKREDVYKKYAENQTKAVEKKGEKAVDARRDWVAVMSDSTSSNQAKMAVHKKLQEAEEKRAADAERALQSATERKAYAEMARFQEVKTRAETRAEVFKNDLGNWKQYDARGDRIATPDINRINEIREEINKSKEDVIGITKIGTAVKEENTPLKRLGRVSPFLNFEKSQIVKTRKWLYGEGSTIRGSVAKKLRDNPNKGGKEALAAIAKVLGEEMPEAKEGGKEGGGEKKT